jgi:hypothetical protein
MLIKDYAYITDEDVRLDAVVTNTKYFLENYETCKENIRLDIEHNYNIFLEIFREENKLLASLELNEIDKHHWFDQNGFSHLLKIQK